LKNALESESLYIDPIFDEDANIINISLSDINSFSSGFISYKIDFYKKLMGNIEKNSNNTFNIKQINFINNIEFKSTNFLNKSLSKLVSKNPKKLNISEIEPGLGEGFIPLKVYQEFANYFFEINNCKIHHINGSDKFIVKGSSSTKANTAFHFQKRNRGYVTWKDIFEHALSQYYPSYNYTVDDGNTKKTFLDKELTSNIQFKIDELHKEFSLWIILDKNKGYANFIENLYYKKNTADVLKEFNASYLTFKGLNPKFTPHEHQKNCVAKNIYNGGGIVDHKVGYGKTLSIALINQKRKQLKLGHKTLVVAMNANYMKVNQEILDYFPQAKTLCLNPDDFYKKKNEFLYKIANFDWDMVIVPHSVIERFPTEIKIDQKLLQEELKIISDTLLAHNSDEFLDRRSYSNMIKQQEKIESSLLLLQDKLRNRRASGYLSFNDLGFFHLVVDESHEFKNLPFHTKHNRVSGLGNPTGAKKNRILLSIIRTMQDKHNADKGVTFLSGTTLSNSLTELYNIFRYLRPRKMKSLNLNSFDQWARSYARLTNEFEHTLSGEVKHKQRFRFFVKTPELAKFYNEITHYADEHTFDIGAPIIEPNVVTISPYKVQNDYFESIKKFLKTSDVKHLIGYSHNSTNITKAKGLIATSQGRKASLDMRLIAPYIEEDTKSKINVLANMIQNYYVKYNEQKMVQVIFCDIGTPSSNKLSFNVYQAIKNNLIQKGINEQEISFIHDAKNDKQKAILFDNVNKGNIRVIIGSTRKMGTGVNMQKRIGHMYHLDIPYRPSDFEQRNGRGGRPGNNFSRDFLKNKVPVTVLAVENSIDSYLFNLLAMKNNFIKQFKNANLTERKIDFGLIDETGGMNFEQYLEACSPNSLLPKKLKIENKIKEIKLRKISFDQNLSKIKFDVKKFSSHLSKANDDFFNYTSRLNDFNKKVSIKFKERSFFLNEENNKVIGKQILNVFNAKYNKASKEFNIAKLSNNYLLNVRVYFKIDYDTGKDIKNYTLILKDNSGYDYIYKNGVVSKDIDKNGKYIFNAIKQIPELIEITKNKINKYKDYIDNGKKEINKKFPLEEKLKECQSQLEDIIILMNEENENEKNELNLNKSEFNL
ncbi:helicase-related protein, partial [Tenacibaculum ovolyticum]|uniref:helicase-related protein n=1 Tax=Tenacibaculum ovolyticum TaxID=104270 RepID=UPI000AEF69EC